jgi:hypothetical protein
MKARYVVATDKAGVTVPNAQQMLCPSCDGETFRIYVVLGHPHLCCTGCEASFCQAGDACGTEVPRG